MRYTKPALTFEQQADLLLSRGFKADKTELIGRLKTVGFYRLCAYWHPFKRHDNTFMAGATLDTVWERYKITGLVLDSWFLTINYARNMCAHHSRLVQRVMAIKPLIPDLKNDPRWHGSPAIRNTHVFGLLTILAYLTAVVPRSRRSAIM